MVERHGGIPVQLKILDVQIIRVFMVLSEQIQKWTAQSGSLISQICKTSTLVHWKWTETEFWKSVVKFYNKRR